jgi:sterol desaturase/sphingolipid hydroxylase (fatty acid hydroxylase superfamily)
MDQPEYGIEIDHSVEPIRLFKSDFLEFFTHISPIVVLIIWLPVSAFFVYRSVMEAPGGQLALYIPIAILVGVVVWTFAEYTLHRFLFHHHATSPRAKRVFFLFHGVHHAQPQCKTRLVMPPAVSIPMALLFYGLFALVVGVLLGAATWVAPLFAGFIIGYLLYDMTHYATHHFPMRWGYLKFVKRYHMKHHFRTPNLRLGVSSPAWDYVFGTIPR